MPLQRCPPRTRYSAMVGAQAFTIFLRCRGGLDVKIAPRVSPKPASHCLNSSRGTHTFITALLVCFSTPSCRLTDCPSLHAKRLLPPNLPAKERISSLLPKCGNRKSPEQQTGTTPPKQSKPNQTRAKQSKSEQSRAEQSKPKHGLLLSFPNIHHPRASACSPRAVLSSLRNGGWNFGNNQR